MSDDAEPDQDPDEDEEHLLQGEPVDVSQTDGTPAALLEAIIEARAREMADEADGED